MPSSRCSCNPNDRQSHRQQKVQGLVGHIIAAKSVETTDVNLTSLPHGDRCLGLGFTRGGYNITQGMSVRNMKRRKSSNDPNGQESCGLFRIANFTQDASFPVRKQGNVHCEAQASRSLPRILRTVSKAFPVCLGTARNWSLWRCPLPSSQSLASQIYQESKIRPNIVGGR